jgi:hypothetical protein
VLCEAIRATFARRQTELPGQTPLALTAEFYEDATKARQWTAFLLRSSPAHGDLTLAVVAERLRGLLTPAREALFGNRPFPMVWPPAGPWPFAQADG